MARLAHRPLDHHRHLAPQATLSAERNHSGSKTFPAENFCAVSRVNSAALIRASELSQ
jgi:hypothetical protein